MLRSYKTEIKPTIEHRNKINRSIGTCRFIYNFYLAHNREIYEKENKFVSGYNFSIWINNEYIPNNPEFSWINEVSGKSVKQSITNAQRASSQFFDKKTNIKKLRKSRNGSNADFRGNTKVWKNQKIIWKEKLLGKISVSKSWKYKKFIINKQW